MLQLSFNPITSLFEVNFNALEHQYLIATFKYEEDALTFLGKIDRDKKETA